MAEATMGTIRFKVGEQQIEATMTLPAGPMTPLPMVPFFRDVAEIVVEEGVRVVVAEGKSISCKAGCGACCRQLVPISQLEARRLADFVSSMPEPRRTIVAGRFAEARRRFEAAGLWDKLSRPEDHRDDQLHSLGMDYFTVGVPCPFLEEESCSIYEERPITCREYLVTSPAEHCLHPSSETIDRVPLPGKVFTAVARLGVDPSCRFVNWVPLVAILSWTTSHPVDTTPPKEGSAWLEEFFGNLSGGPRSEPSSVG